MAKWTLGQLSISDLIDALAGWGLSVSHEQLIRPAADFVEGVYCACLQQVTDIDLDALRDPVKNSLSSSQVDDKVSFAIANTVRDTDVVFRIFTPLPWQRIFSSFICTLDS